MGPPWLGIGFRILRYRRPVSQPHHNRRRRPPHHPVTHPERLWHTRVEALRQPSSANARLVHDHHCRSTQNGNAAHTGPAALYSKFATAFGRRRSTKGGIGLHPMCGCVVLKLHTCTTNVGNKLAFSLFHLLY